MDFADHSSHFILQKRSVGGTPRGHLRACIGNGYILIGVNILRLSRLEIGVRGALRGFDTDHRDTDHLFILFLTASPTSWIPVDTGGCGWMAPNLGRPRIYGPEFREEDQKFYWAVQRATSQPIKVPISPVRARTRRPSGAGNSVSVIGAM